MILRKQALNKPWNAKSSLWQNCQDVTKGVLKNTSKMVLRYMNCFLSLSSTVEPLFAPNL